MADDAVEAQLGGPADGPLRRPVGVAEVVDPGPAQRLDRDLVRVWPTARGFDFLNDLQSLFLADSAAG